MINELKFCGKYSPKLSKYQNPKEWISFINASLEILSIFSFICSSASSSSAKNAGFIENVSISSFDDFWSSISNFLILSTSLSNKETLNPNSLPKGQISIISPLIETSPSLVTISTK